VVSRRSVLERERASLKEQTLKVLEEGVYPRRHRQEYYGTMARSSISAGIDGLLHITDMAWGRLQHPSEVLEWSATKSKSLSMKYDPERERVSLGMKQIMPDPWTKVRKRIRRERESRARWSASPITARSWKSKKGVEGLIHVSEMSWSKRAVHPSKVVNPGRHGRSAGAGR